jgi:ABC-type transport system substrate-binding protein
MPLNTLLEGVEGNTVGFYSWVSEPNYPHADALLDRFTSEAIGTGLGGNISNYANPDYDALIEQLRATTDPAQKEALYLQAQEMIMADLPWLLLYQENLYQATRADVEGFDFGAFNYLNLHDISLNR